MPTSNEGNRKLKLFLSRDQHAELTRKVIGRSHSDRLYHGESHRSNIYLVELFQTIDTGMEEILRSELLQMSIPVIHSQHTTKISSKVQEIASMKAELSREEKEKRNFEGILGSESNSVPSVLRDENSHSGLSLEFTHTTSFGSSTPTSDHWSPFTNFGSNDSCEKEIFPSVATSRDMISLNCNSSSSTSSFPRSGNGRNNPLVARRNSNIDRMLNEVSQRPSRNLSPKVPSTEFPSSSSVSNNRFSFYVPSLTPEKTGYMTPPSSASSGIASSTDGEITMGLLPLGSISKSTSDLNINGNRRLSNGEKAEKRFVTTFPSRPVQPKSPVITPSIHAMSQQERVLYHQNIARKLTQNFLKGKA